MSYSIFGFILLPIFVDVSRVILSSGRRYPEGGVLLRCGFVPGSDSSIALPVPVELNADIVSWYRSRRKNYISVWKFGIYVLHNIFAHSYWLIGTALSAFLSTSF